MNLHRLPADPKAITWVLVGEWQEVRTGTLRKEGPDDEASEWLSFEPDDDYTNERVWCRIAAIRAFRVSP
jgi:hypothetical protein